jgi:hypothetical protein
MKHSFLLRILLCHPKHIEDDMSSHEQARQDCLEALKYLSLLPSRSSPRDASIRINDSSNINNTAISFLSNSHVVPTTTNETVRDIVSQIQNFRAADLSLAQLELILEYKRGGQYLHSYLVSLGDVGRKDIRHEPGDAGTTQSFIDARSYLQRFGNIPVEIVTGNHDLEGLDEFQSDQDNLQAFMDCFHKPTPQFARYIGERTLLLGLSTTRFRDAPYSSHEVHVDNTQIQWFLDQVRNHPESDGWKILVVSHAPIMGSGLRVLQNVHVTNGCAWLNHCSPTTRALFIRTVLQNPAIKMWFSGHFHLSHDYQDSISTVGSCTFVQVGVVGPQSTRDGRRQTRVVQGCADRLKVYTLNHHERTSYLSSELIKKECASVRLDVEIDFINNRVLYAHDNQDYDHADWFQAYTPQEEDGYVPC